jgi:hypothetical protein
LSNKGGLEIVEIDRELDVNVTLIGSRRMVN